MALRFTVPTSADAERIAQVHVACWREAYADIVPIEILDNVDMADRVARWQRYVGNADSLIYVASDGGTLIGFVHGGTLAPPLVEGADGHIFALYILAHHHRRGIGRSLLGMTARSWLERGGRAMSVGVLTANPGARAFYETLGARFVRPDIYEWHGHPLDESIYIFENLEELSRFA